MKDQSWQVLKIMPKLQLGITNQGSQGFYKPKQPFFRRLIVRIYRKGL